MRELTFWAVKHLLSSTKHGLKNTRRNIQAWLRFWRSYRQFRAVETPTTHIEPRFLYPKTGEDIGYTPIDVVYYYQDAWAFEKIYQNKPEWHVDVGSHHKLVSLLSKVVSVTMVDIRPLPVTLNTLKFRQGSILSLPYEDGSVPSLSSICVIEHIGLGRYGDPIDPNGTEKAIKELKRVLKPGGDLYISVPIDDENRVYFNAHRAFREDYILELFAPFTIIEKRYIFGDEFGENMKKGFGTGCYHFKA